MGDRIDVAAVKAANKLSEVVARRSVKLRKAGREWKGCCPFHDDSEPSFYVNDEKGVFHCFGCDASGDVIEFVRRADDVSFSTAVTLLGANRLSGRPAAKAAKAAKAATGTMSAARRTWAAARQGRGTLAETYLRSRAITILPDSIRFAVLSHRDAPGAHPTMVLALHDVTGAFSGIQRVFLAPDGRRKAGIVAPGAKDDSDKLSLGRIKGSAIRFGPPQPSIIVTGGPEDGLSLRQELADQSVWVSCGEGMLGAVELPDVVTSVFVGADNDATGERRAQEAAEAYARSGRSVSIMRPHPLFKDFNDQLRGRRK